MISYVTFVSILVAVESVYIVACSCPSPLDNCDLMTGQCSNCPPLVEGRSCNVCVANSFGDPSIGCMVSSSDALDTLIML